MVLEGKLTGQRGRDVAPWYRRDDYQRIIEVMDDGHEFPATFDEWEKRAKSQMARAAAMGFTLETVVLDPEEFVAFCKAKNLPRGSEARARIDIQRRLARDAN